jgi:clan AA aspartic protease
MMSGEVTSSEAILVLKVQGPRNKTRRIVAVIDTGYTGSLTLPPKLIKSLGLRWQVLNRGTLADGSRCLFEMYEGRVVWDGRTRSILVDEADADPLIGMELLSGYELKIQVRSHSRVKIKKLQSTRGR